MTIGFDGDIIGIKTKEGRGSAHYELIWEIPEGIDIRIDSEKCIGCLECVAYCPVGAIKEISEKATVQIIEDECVECGCCLRSAGCPTEAFWQPKLSFPRVLRAEFSDPAIVKSTGVTGRGTEETKTNDGA